MGICRVVISELGSAYCGGKVGSTGGRMCVKKPSLCETRTHRRSKVTLVPETHSASGTYVCIRVKSAQDVVLISLLTPMESLGSMWTDIKDEV